MSLAGATAAHGRPRRACIAPVVVSGAASACDGLIGLTDPTVDTRDAASSLDATQMSDALDTQDTMQPEEAPVPGEASHMEGAVDAGEASADSSGGDAGADAAEEGPVLPSCVPKTCQQLGYTCGTNADGCGDVLQCGTCTAPQYCGGGGVPSQCGGGGDL